MQVITTAMQGRVTHCIDECAPDIGWIINSLSPLMTRCSQDLPHGNLSLLKRQQAIRTVSLQQESVQWYLHRSCKPLHPFVL